ncbi:MAG: hypothetical protein ACRCZP_07880 [Phycicoccus sp.]
MGRGGTASIMAPAADDKVKLLGVYPEGKINAPEKFAKWLKDIQKKANPKTK